MEQVLFYEGSLFDQGVSTPCLWRYRGSCRFLAREMADAIIAVSKSDRIINLEAMACETPVVASAMGGIKEVVVDGETGFLLRYERRSENDHEPRDPEKFAHDLAKGMMKILSDPELSVKMGLKGRERVESEFGWDKVAEKVMSIYQDLNP
jgi:glycosyltransferase involved in cell wall biosynthesis